MRIAILSDIHDNIPKLREVLERASDADVLLCCGDLCSPFIVKELGRGSARPVHVVFGNNDGDRFRIAEVARSFPRIEIHGEFARLELGGKRIALHHFDDVGRALGGSPEFDVVCFGHNHRFELTREGTTLLVNPGEVFGGLTGQSTFVLYDTASDEAQRVDV